jgi:hypothetical protein
MVVGFQSEEMRVLTHELRAAGHHVLGAVGKQGAHTFLRAAEWEVVLVPRGGAGDKARSWVEELGLALPVIAVPANAEATEWLARFARGESPEPAMVEPPVPPEAPVAPEPIIEVVPAPEPVEPLAEGLPASRRRRRPETRAEPEPEGREPHPDLVSKLAQVRFGDYHSILEVEPGGSPYAIREQRERLAHRFSPRGWGGRLSREEIDMLDEICRGLADAWTVLGDPELAARYERALAHAPSGSRRT